MASFNYVAIDSTGKQVKETIDVATEADVVAYLKSKGLTATKIEAANALNSNIQLSFLEPKVTPRDLSVFCRQMVSVLSAGVSISKALEMLGEQTANKALANAIVGCKKKIEGGSTMHEAMREYPKVFSDIMCTMIAAGEESGSLETSFERIAEKNEKDTKLKALVKKSTMYPMILGILVVVIVTFMLTVIVPKFEDFLGSLGGSLPPLTQFLVDASDFMKNNILLIGAVVVALIIGFKMFKKTAFGRHLIDKIMLKVPLLGTLTTKTACSNVMRMMATLLATGISMIDAISITADTMTNIYYKEALLDVKTEVAQGTPLSDALEHTKMFPPMVHHMARIGEETGDLVSIFDRSALYYDEEVEASTQAVTAALEPMVIIAMAGIVGTMVIALLMPMMSMYDSLDSM
ncbi:MAG: type II secretion system F family protein [Clostridia bacterium]|nr:type II secretion system F family protein [Clostridia bacterium]